VATNTSSSSECTDLVPRVACACMEVWREKGRNKQLG
jgi:hypothetical protein